MRILLVNKFHYLRGGAERCYFDTARILADHNHDLAFFSMHHKENKPSRWSRFFIDEVDYENRETGLWGKICSALKIIYNFQAQKNLEKLIKEFKPEVAHLHNIYHQLSPSVIKTLKKYNIPVVMTLHDYKLICPNYNLLVRGKIWEKSRPDKYYKCFLNKGVKDSYLKSLVCTIEAYWHKWLRVYDKVDAFISPSRFLINKFKEFGFKKEIIYLPNPLFIDNISYKNNFSEEKYILYFGRLSGEKGVDDLIRAFSLLKTDCKLIIAGTGPQEEQLKKMAQEKGLDKKIIFAGYKEGAPLWNLVKQAEFVVAPSKWYENSPYNIAEAMSLTKIVVCANIGGLPEIIKNGENGFLFEAGNVADLAKVLGRLLNLNEEAKRKIGEQARRTGEEKNNKEVYYKSLMDIYGKIIGKYEAGK